MAWFTCLTSPNVAGEEAVREYKKGDEIAAVVLQVDAERERISLALNSLQKIRSTTGLH